MLVANSGLQTGGCSADDTLGRAKSSIEPRKSEGNDRERLKMRLSGSPFSDAF